MVRPRLSHQGQKALIKITKRLALIFSVVLLIYSLAGFALLYWFVNTDVTSINEDLKHKEEVFQSNTIRSFAEVIQLSRSVISHENFNPCRAVCLETSIEEWPNDPVKMVRFIRAYFRNSPQKALLDPNFNFAILIYHNMGDLFPARLVELLNLVDADQGNAVASHPVLAAQILWDVPGFLIHAKSHRELQKERGQFLNSYKKILFQCQRGVITPKVAENVCLQDFDLWFKD